jgi:D-alanyl-D-alanine carboxypeptidase
MPTSMPTPVSIRAACLTCLLSMCSIFAPQRTLAQATDYRARLDSLFNALDANQRTMGSVTIRRAGRIIYHRTLGFRDSTATGWSRSDSLTAFRIGSVTKPFTAAMIYQLIDAHRLTLDTRLARFFPQIPSADSITIRDLLGHTSGLPDYTQGMEPMVPLDRIEIVRRISTAPTQFRAGTERRYNNTNYVLLGYIIAAVTHSEYATELRRRIVARAGLMRTRVGGAVAPPENESRAYYFNDGHWERQPDEVISNAGGAGAITSTTDDLTLFLSSLFEQRLISKSSLHEMTHGFTGVEYRSGKGLSPFEIPGTGKSGFSHDGSIGAHVALVGYIPADSLALALTINGHNYPINRIFFQIWSVVYGIDSPLPTFTSVALDSASASPFLGVFKAAAYGLTITVRRTASGIEARTEGQDVFPLTYLGRNRFQFVPSGILLDFATPVNDVSPRFTLYQQKAAIPLLRVATVP